MSPRWFIGLFMLMVICSIISNILEDADVLTTAQVASMDAMSGNKITEVQDVGVGGSFTTGTVSTDSWWEILTKSLSSDYSFFYTVDYATTEAECTGTWNADISACQSPNEFMIIRYVFFWPLTAAVALFAILTVIQLIRG